MRMSLENVKTVWKTLKSGERVPYYYHRKTGKRIKGKPGTAEFFRSYEAAQVDDASAEGSFSEVLTAYRKSQNFLGKADSTRRNYNLQIDNIRVAFGDIEISAFDNRKIRAEIFDYRDEAARKSASAAEAFVRMMKILIKFAHDRGLLNHNHLAGTERLSGKSRAEDIWTREEIQRILLVSGPELRWAIRLALLTAQRQSDLIRAEWGNIKNGVFHCTQLKTGAKVEIPVGASLAKLLAEIPQRAKTILTNTQGNSWCKDGSSLRQAWRASLRRAGLAEDGRRFHDMRGTAITLLADAGCSPIQIAAMSGHSLEHVARILKHYLARTQAQAQHAVNQLEATWIGKLAA